MVIKLSKTNPNFVPPDSPIVNAYPKILEERYNRTVELYRKSYLSYVIDSQSTWKEDTKEKWVLRLIENSEKECVSYQLISIVRVQLNNTKRLPMFLNEDNTFNSEVQSAIFAKVYVSILDENSIKFGNPTVRSDPDNNVSLFFHTYTLGRVRAPNVKLEYNRNMTKVINSELAGTRPVYYLPDTWETVQMLKDLFNRGERPVKGYKVGVAAKHAPVLTEVHIVPNEKEWLEGDISLLNECARSTKIRLSERAGGLEAFVNLKSLEERLVKQGVSELTLEKLTREDILEMLKHKKNNKREKENETAKQQVQQQKRSSTK